MVGLVLYYKNDSPPVRSVKLCLQSLDLTVKLKQVTFSSPGDLEPLFLKVRGQWPSKMSNLEWWAFKLRRSTIVIFHKLLLTIEDIQKFKKV